MIQVTNFIKLDFNRSNDITIPTIEWDQGSRFVRVQLQNNNQNVDITGSQVVITVIRNDLEEIIESCNLIDAKEGIIEFEISKSMVARQGDMLCQLKLSDNDSLLSSQLFKISVNNTLMVSLEESRSEMNVLIHALGEVQNIDNRFAQTNAQLSVTNQRIDGIVSLSEGSTTGDAELMDGRICYDGHIYNSIGEAIRHQISKIANCIKLKESLLSNNLIDTNHLIGYSMSDVLKLDNTDNRYYSDFIQISPLAEVGDGLNLKCIVDFNENELVNYNGFNIEYYNKQKKKITYYQIWNAVVSNYPVTGVEFIRIVANQSVYDNIKNYTLKSFSLGFNIREGQLYTIELISEFDEVNDKIKEMNNNYVDYDKIIRSINRIGYDVYSSSTPPQQSLASFKMAYEKGFRILLCDLRFTNDNVPVLHHDSKINSYAKNIDGSEIVGDVTIATSTYNDLLNYDYGVYKGQQYKGTKLMTLQDMLKLCRNLGCELYIEVKAMNEDQCKIACDLVKAYRMVDKTSWSGTTPQMKYVVANIDTARVSTMPQTLSDKVISDLVSLKTSKNKVFVFGWNTTVLNKELVNKLIENDLEFEIGTIDTEDGIKNYFNQGDEYYYCTGISSNSVVAGKVLETK